MNFDVYDFKGRLRNAVQFILDVDKLPIILSLILLFISTVIGNVINVLVPVLEVFLGGFILNIFLFVLYVLIAAIWSISIIGIVGSIIEWSSKRENILISNYVSIIKNMIIEYKEKILLGVFLPRLILLFLSTKLSGWILFEFSSRGFLMTFMSALFNALFLYGIIMIIIRFLTKNIIGSIAEYDVRNMQSEIAFILLVYMVLLMIPFVNVIMLGVGTVIVQAIVVVFYLGRI